MRRLLLVAAALALHSLVHLWDPDVWWHLATGRFIVEHHTLPVTDPFSFTMSGAPWRAVDWLAELILYGAWRVGGATGLGLLTVACAFGMLAVIAATLRELEVDRAPSLGLIAIPAGRGLIATATGTEGSKWTVALTLEWARPSPSDSRLWIPALLALAALIAGLADWRRHAFLLGLWLLGVALASRF